MRGETGFTLVEMLIASAILITVVGVVFSITSPAQGVFQTQLEVSDLQQRLRVGIDTLTRDLVMAGAGISIGDLAGPLSSYFAPLVPYRRGHAGDDARAGVFYRQDAVSIAYVPPTAAQATLTGALDLGGEAIVAARVNCGPDAHDRLCGFAQDMRVLLVDKRGVFDTGTVVEMHSQGMRLSIGAPLSAAYDRGDAAVVEVATHTYYVKDDASTQALQLRHYDGFRTDRPVLDHVVKLEFEYFGDPRPPRLPSSDSSSPDGDGRPTSGPRPPPVGVDEAADSWGAGENCLFAVESDRHVPRLTTLGSAASPVRLSPAMLQDGPWCPDAAHPTRFDADLFRVRRVRMVLRAQVAASSMRGPAGVLFARGGSRTSAERFVPDHEISMDVALRNLGAR